MAMILAAGGGDRKSTAEAGISGTTLPVGGYGKVGVRAHVRQDLDGERW
jgi:hypothetical protein